MYEQNIKEDSERIMNLADDMAAAATSFSAHGYDAFIQSRDYLKQYLVEMQTKYGIAANAH